MASQIVAISTTQSRQTKSRWKVNSSPCNGKHLFFSVYLCFGLISQFNWKLIKLNEIFK